MTTAAYPQNIPAFGRLAAAMLAASEAASQLAGLRDKARAAYPAIEAAYEAALSCRSAVDAAAYAREAEKAGIEMPSLKAAAVAPRAALKAAYEAAEAAFKEVRETADWRCVNVMLATRGGAKAPKAAAAFEAAKADEVAAKAAAEEVGEIFRSHASGPDVWADNTALMISRAHRAAIAREADIARDPEGLWDAASVCKADPAAVAARRGH